MSENISKARSGRVKRTPLGRGGRLEVGELDDKFYYRFINDTDDRIARAVAAGYEHVPADEVQFATKRVGDSGEVGSNSVVSVGAGTKAFLMKLPKEFREEDIKAKHDEIRQREAALKNPDLEGAYGKLDISK